MRNDCLDSLVRAILIALLAAMPLSLVAQRATAASVFFTEFTLELPCYNPTKITFNYEYTHNHSLRDISTLGASLYKHTGGPTYIEFVAESVDTYRFTIDLKYSSPQNQSIIIAMWSGNEPMQGFQLKSNYEEITIYVTLSVREQPSYPSPEDVAEATIAQIQADLQNTYNSINEAIKGQNEAVFTNTLLNFAAVAGVVIMSAVYYLDRRKSQVRGGTLS